jgi:DNA-binding NarL/FixJ family response regulator
MLMGVKMAAQEKIRVLIVDDIAETRENIRRLLQFDPTIEVAGSARSGQEGIDLAQQLKPDVVIMDINMPDLDGITATERIEKRFRTFKLSFYPSKPMQIICVEPCLLEHATFLQNHHQLMS